MAPAIERAERGIARAGRGLERIVDRGLSRIGLIQQGMAARVAKRGRAGRVPVFVQPQIVPRGIFQPSHRRGRAGRSVATPRELKHHSIATQTTASSAVVNNWVEISNDKVCEVKLGTGPGDRIGHRIYLKSLQVTVHLHREFQNAAAITQADVAKRFATVRIVVAVNMQNNGIATNGEQIYDNANFGIQAFRNLDYSDKFKVLKTVVRHLKYDDQAGASAANAQQQQNWYWKGFFNFKKPLRIDLAGANGTLNERTSADIKVFAAVDAADADFAVQDWNFTSRIRYYD